MSQRPDTCAVPMEPHAQAGRLNKVLRMGMDTLSIGARSKQVAKKTEEREHLKGIKKGVCPDIRPPKERPGMTPANVYNTVIRELSEAGEARAMAEADEMATKMLPCGNSAEESYAVVAVGVYKLFEEFGLVEEYGTPADSQTFYDAINTFIGVAQLIEAAEADASTPMAVGGAYDALPEGEKQRAKVKFTEPDTLVLIGQYFLKTSNIVRTFREGNISGVKDFIVELGPIIQSLAINMLSLNVLPSWTPGQKVITDMNWYYWAVESFKKAKRLANPLSLLMKNPPIPRQDIADDAILMWAGADAVEFAKNDFFSLEVPDPINGSDASWTAMDWAKGITRYFWAADVVLSPQWKFAVYLGNLVSRLLIKSLVYKIDSVEEFVKLNNKHTCTKWRADLYNRLEQQGPHQTPANGLRITRVAESHDVWIKALDDVAEPIRKRPDELKKTSRAVKGVMASNADLSKWVSWAGAALGTMGQATFFSMRYMHWRSTVMTHVTLINESISEFDLVETELDNAGAPRPPPGGGGGGGRDAVDILFGEDDDDSAPLPPRPPPGPGTRARRERAARGRPQRLRGRAIPRPAR